MLLRPVVSISTLQVSKTQRAILTRRTPGWATAVRRCETPYLPKDETERDRTRQEILKLANSITTWYSTMATSWNRSFRMFLSNYSACAAPGPSERPLVDRTSLATVASSTTVEIRDGAFDLETKMGRFGQTITNLNSWTTIVIGLALAMYVPSSSII